MSSNIRDPIKLKVHSDSYFHESNIDKTPEYGQSEAWSLSEKLVGEKFSY